MKAIRAFFIEQDEKFDTMGPRATFDEERAELSSRRGGGYTERRSMLRQGSISREDRSLLNTSDNAEVLQSSIGRTALKRKSTMARKCFVLE